MTNRTPITFYVRGRGQFPFDMLRYDACWPLTPEDAAMLSDGWSWRTVRLVAPYGTFTPGRWASFGWSANEQDVWSGPSPFGWAVAET